MTSTELSYRSNNDLRRLNLANVLQIVHLSNGATRSEIAAETGLNRSTVLDLLNSLEERGLVVQSQTSGSNEIGRPSITVSTSNKIVSFAVLPRLSELDLAVVGLGGTIITQARLPLAKGTTPKEAAKKASDWIQKIRSTLPEGTLVSGIGVAAAGPVRFGKGEIRFAPSLNWREVPFVELLKQDVYQPLPVEQQIALLKVNDEGLFSDLKTSQISEFESQFLERIDIKYGKEMTALAKSGVLDDDFGDKLIELASSIIDQMNA
jgi:hypothetical protein